MVCSNTTIVEHKYGKLSSIARSNESNNIIADPTECNPIRWLCIQIGIPIPFHVYNVTHEFGNFCLFNFTIYINFDNVNYQRYLLLVFYSY